MKNFRRILYSIYSICISEVWGPVGPQFLAGCHTGLLWAFRASFGPFFGPPLQIWTLVVSASVSPIILLSPFSEASSFNIEHANSSMTLVASKVFLWFSMFGWCLVLIGEILFKLSTRHWLVVSHLKLVREWQAEQKNDVQERWVRSQICSVLSSVTLLCHSLVSLSDQNY